MGFNNMSKLTYQALVLTEVRPDVTVVTLRMLELGDQGDIYNNLLIKSVIRLKNINENKQKFTIGAWVGIPSHCLKIW